MYSEKYNNAFAKFQKNLPAAVNAKRGNFDVDKHIFEAKAYLRTFMTAYEIDDINLNMYRNRVGDTGKNNYENVKNQFEKLLNSLHKEVNGEEVRKKLHCAAQIGSSLFVDDVKRFSNVILNFIKYEETPCSGKFVAIDHNKGENLTGGKRRRRSTKKRKSSKKSRKARRSRRHRRSRSSKK